MTEIPFDLHAEPTTDVFASLPVFPLPGVVLMPSALLPLHVFEPRYRKMLADALAGDRMFAVVMLRPTPIAEEPVDVGCIVVSGLTVNGSSVGKVVSGGTKIQKIIIKKTIQKYHSYYK